MNLRRRAARILGRIPGGRLPLEAGRAAIRSVQFIRSRFTPHARIPRWVLRAHRFLELLEWQRAVEVYDRILAVDPSAAGCFYRRAFANYKQGRFDEAFRDCETALALRELLESDRSDALLLHSILLMTRGESEASIQAGFRSRWHRTYGTDPKNTLPPFGCEFVETLAETLHDLAEMAIIHRSDLATAKDLYLRVGTLQQQYAEWLSTYGQDVLYLNEEWTRNIGHTALLDYLLKMKDLGWTSWKEIVLLAPPARTANPAYLSCFRSRLRLMKSNPLPAGPRHFAAAFGFRVSSLLHLPDGSTPYLPEALGVIQEEWERQGRGPQLALSPEDIRFGQEQLRAMGVPDGAWFVGLHVRSKSYYGEQLSSPQSHRNAMIESYVPAIEAITRRGGWVFRMGDSNMPPLAHVPGSIDYARSRFKSDRMDAFLCARSRFFIGVASGLGNVPATFGVPCLMTNWVSNSLPFFSRNDMFLPKLLRRTADGTLLTFGEWLSRPVRDASYSGEGLQACGLEVVDNTPEELRAATMQMMDYLDGTWHHTSASREREAAIAALARSHGQRGFSRIVPDFLERHAALLPVMRIDRAA